MTEDFNFSLQYKEDGVVKTVVGAETELYSTEVTKSSDGLSLKIIPKRK